MADMLSVPRRSKEEKESLAYQNLMMGIVPQNLANIWQAIKHSDGKKIGGGYAPWRFAAVAGVLTAQNTIDARLWNHYRQFQGATNDEHSPDKGESNDGEYP